MGAALVLARAALGAQRPHRVLLLVERGQADAMASNQRPGEAVPLLRQALADQRALDVEETPRVREVMTFLGKALLLSGKLDEAASCFAEATAMHERLTGGANFEAAGAHTWQGRVAVMQGQGAKALAYFDAADAIARPLGDEGAFQVANRASLRAWALVLAGRGEEVLAADDALAAQPPSGPIAMRHGVARAAALRAAGRAADAVAIARRAVDAAVAGDSPALEHGLALVEAGALPCGGRRGGRGGGMSCPGERRLARRPGRRRRRPRLSRHLRLSRAPADAAAADGPRRRARRWQVSAFHLV